MAVDALSTVKAAEKPAASRPHSLGVSFIFIFVSGLVDVAASAVFFELLPLLMAVTQEDPTRFLLVQGLSLVWIVTGVFFFPALERGRLSIPAATALFNMCSIGLNVAYSLMWLLEPVKNPQFLQLGAVTGIITVAAAVMFRKEPKKMPELSPNEILIYVVAFCSVAFAAGMVLMNQAFPGIPLQLGMTQWALILAYGIFDNAVQPLLRRYVETYDSWLSRKVVIPLVAYVPVSLAFGNLVYSGMELSRAIILTGVSAALFSPLIAGIMSKNLLGKGQLLRLASIVQLIVIVGGTILTVVLTENAF